MSSEVSKEQKTSTQQEEHPTGLLASITGTVTEAVKGTLEAAKEAVFGEDEKKETPTTESSGTLSYVMNLAKEAVFGSEESAEKKEEKPAVEKKEESKPVEKKQENVSQQQQKETTEKPAAHEEEEGSDEEYEGVDEEGKPTKLRRPKRAPAKMVGGRRIVQADHPHLGLNHESTKDRLHHQVEGNSSAEHQEVDPSQLALQKAKEEKALLQKKVEHKVEKAALSSAPSDSKATPSTYHPPEPTHSHSNAPALVNHHQ